MKYFFTSESVGEGHPDKVCDQISDGVLDEVLRLDSNKKHSRVACETYVTMGLLIVGGEITTNAYIDIQKLARGIIKDIGYTHPKYGFDYETCAIINTIHSQSPDIAQGVNVGVPETKELCSVMRAMKLPSICRCRLSWRTN